MANDAMHYVLVVLLLIAIGVSTLAYMNSGAVAASVSMLSAQSQNSSLSSIDAIPLYGQTLPAGSYMHLMDISPEQVVIGHLALKVPCDTNGISQIVLLLGSAPNFQAIHLNSTEELTKISTGGQLCIYHFYVGKGYATPTNLELTDVAIFNPTNQTIVFPPTSTAVISLNKVIPA
ncbi:MAG: hypothetical protein KGH49_01660 [Candidatus Micrarchaeota archaeon]|nr:hypothetical protein [Candidatus Micrarchaeota archaeon]